MLSYIELKPSEIGQLKPLVNALMAFQKSKTTIKPELFDTMSFETRLVPSVASSSHNFFILVKDDDMPVGYVYANIAPKENYVNDFATFFDLKSINAEYVGCLSQFYIDANYRHKGIGSKLFAAAKKWMDTFTDVEDQFIFVSNGNTDALNFYKHKGFKVSHDILEGFITVLRN